MAVHFDGSTYLSTASLNCTDGTSFSMSVWVRNPSQIDSGTGWIFETDPLSTRLNGCTMDFNGWDVFIDDATGSNGDEYNQWYKNDSYYHHLLFSVDSNAGIAAAYLDGVKQVWMQDNPWGSFPFPVAFNGLPLYVGSDSSSGLRGDMDYFWLAPDVSLISGGEIPSGTIAKFRSQPGIQGVPVDPSNYPSSGAILLYGDAAGFATNHGTGGALTLTGTLTDAAAVSAQTFTRVRKTMVVTTNLLVVNKLPIPADWTADGAMIHAIGSGASGSTANTGLGDGADPIGGDGASYAALNSPAFSPGDVLDVQIPDATASGTTIGADTLLKNASGAIVLLARGGNSATVSSIGDVTSAGGAAVAPTGGDYDGSVLVNDVPYTVRPAPFTPISGNDTFTAVTNGSGGGGGGAGGPDGVGQDSGDLRPLYAYQNNYLGHASYFVLSGPKWPMGAAGGTANGGQPSGGTYSLANNLKHADGNPLVPGDSGDPLTATASGGMGQLGGEPFAVGIPTPAYTTGAGAGGGGGPTVLGASPNFGGSGNAGDMWVDTDQNPNLPSFFAGPGGGGGGAPFDKPVASFSGQGGRGGEYGGGGGGGLAGGGNGAAGVIVLEYWTPGGNIVARSRIWGNYQ